MICGIGRYGFQFVNNPERLKISLYKEKGIFKNMNVEEAVNLSTNKIQEIVKEYGENSIAKLVGSRLSNQSIYSIKKFAKSNRINKVLSDIDFYDRHFYKYYKKFFNTYLSKGRISDIETSDLIFILGADLSREVISLKWPIMKAVTGKGAKIVTLGLKNYDYDDFVDYCILADDGNFSLSINNIVYGSNKIFKDIRKSLDKAKNITLIVGDEYILHEDDFNSLYFLVKFIRFDKIKVLQAGHNKGNFRGLLLHNIYDKSYSTSSFINDLKTSTLKALIWVNFYPYEFLQYSNDLLKNVMNVEYKIALDMFNNKFNSLADIVIPVKSIYEKSETYISLDGKIIKTKKLINDKNNLTTESAFFNRLAKNINITTTTDLKKIFNDIDDSINFTYVKSKNKNTEYIESNKLQLNECEYKYKLVEGSNKNVYINQRYHNGLTTQYAYMSFEDNDFKKTYLPSGYEDEENLAQRYTLAKGITVHLKKYK
jgi:NADH dehydrogenase/NADH:ubiquinone oxidoreductase subunit G